ncbi:hypothetical protein [Saccharibacillus sp. JS10]|uniref:hypothetical protein n=1 Tax=Saccharibacillus sp. JS10 TaxID=2950552 RepID=UPI00210EB7DE|nr:hypothetical protein [Saccharibacillus sp. JS10]MCQ4085817.1 hypothetical protein [Saccharibacillus sp. JS10]
MSEHLSRMDRHPSTRKKRRKRPSFKQEWQENQRKLSDTTVLRLSIPENRSVLAEPALTQSASVLQRPETTPRTERSVFEEKKVWTQEPVQEQEVEEELPPRSVVYPSGRIRLAKWFYDTLILLFIMLLGTLLWWGTQTTGVKLPWQ